MTTEIDRFLATATGPARLRSDLRRTTKAVRTFPRALDALEGVRTEIPESLLGGELLGLLGASLQQLLWDWVQPVARRGAVRGSGPEFSGKPGTGGDGRRVEFPALPEAAAEQGRRMGAGASGLPRADVSFPTPDRGDVARSTDLASPLRPARPGARSASGSEDSAHPAHALPGTQAEAAGEQGWRRGSVPSMLARKLDEYWRADRRAAPSGRETWPSPGRDEPAKRPAVLQPTPWFNRPAPPPWPERVARHASGKVAHLLTQSGSNGPAQRVQQTLKADLPEKVEIQNVFNLEVGTGGFGQGSTSDLAEAIADILHEQALQHGIDVT